MESCNDPESAQPLLQSHREDSQTNHTAIVEQEIEAEQREKLQVLYDNASTATLNSVQNFSSAGHYSSKVVLGGVSGAGDASFERELNTCPFNKPRSLQGFLSPWSVQVFLSPWSVEGVRIALWSVMNAFQRLFTPI